MNVFWPAASRVCRNSTPFLHFERCAPQRTYCLARAFSMVSSPVLRNEDGLHSSRRTVPSGCSKSMFESHHLMRTYASRPRIITRYEDLPSDYQDKSGLWYQTTPLSQKDVESIFGKGLRDVKIGDRVLRMVHGRRVAGTLDDPSLIFGFENSLQEKALVWLRRYVPVDERHSAGKRAEMELMEMQQEIVTGAQRLSLYRPNSDAAVESGKKGQKERQNLYGKSALDEIREQNKIRADRAERLERLGRQKQAAELQHSTGTLATQTVTSKVELRRPGENPWLKYYLDRAKVLPETPPDMTFFQRLWRSALVALCVTASLVCFTFVYTPPRKSGRIWPDVPPAAATVSAIIGANFLIFALWRFPPAFRFLNKYFISVPGYPRAAALLGNTFSHQAFGHLAVNMVVLWFVGTRLHDDIGRANFLAMYISAGALSTLVSLAMFTIRGNFVTSSMGASGAIAGLLAAHLWLHRGEYFKPLGLPPDPFPGVPGAALLAFVLGIELFQLRRGWTGGQLLDHYAHLGGYAVGMAEMSILERYNKDVKKQVEVRRKTMERQQKMSVKILRDNGSGRKED